MTLRRFVDRVAIETESAEAADWLKERREREGYLISIAGAKKSEP